MERDPNKLKETMERLRIETLGAGSQSIVSTKDLRVVLDALYEAKDAIGALGEVPNIRVYRALRAFHAKLPTRPEKER